MNLLNYENLTYVEYINDEYAKNILFFTDSSEKLEIYKDFFEYFYNNSFNIYAVEYDDSISIENNLTNIKKFINFKFKDKEYNDIVLFGQGLGALISYYFAINMPFKYFILSSMLFDSNLNILYNIAKTKIETLCNFKESKLAKTYDYENKSPNHFNDVYRLMKYVRKNMSKIRDDANVLLIYGQDDRIISIDKLNKHIMNINNKFRKFTILRNKNSKHNVLIDKNNLSLYKEINKYLGAK